MMRDVEHDEAILICALPLQARRLLRRHCPFSLSPTLTPRNANSEVFQHSHNATNRRLFAALRALQNDTHRSFSTVP